MYSGVVVVVRPNIHTVQHPILFNIAVRNSKDVVCQCTTSCHRVCLVTTDILPLTEIPLVFIAWNVYIHIIAADEGTFGWIVSAITGIKEQ